MKKGHFGNGKKIPVYDALYLVQADKYGNFVTSDEMQREIGKKMGIKVEYVDGKGKDKQT